MSVHVCHVKLYLHHFFITGTSTFKEKPVCRSHYQSESDSNSGSGGEEFDHELAHNRARLVKEKLEREEFLQVVALS